MGAISSIRIDEDLILPAHLTRERELAQEFSAGTPGTVVLLPTDPLTHRFKNPQGCRLV